MATGKNNDKAGPRFVIRVEALLHDRPSFLRSIRHEFGKNLWAICTMKLDFFHLAQDIRWQEPSYDKNLWAICYNEA
jgi:hypothetical protein